MNLRKMGHHSLTGLVLTITSSLYMKQLMMPEDCYLLKPNVEKKSGFITAWLSDCAKQAVNPRNLF